MRRCLLNSKYLSIMQPPHLYITQVLDIFTRLVRSMFDNQVTAKGDNTSRFLDSQFAAMLLGNYPKFKKVKPKGQVNFLRKSYSFVTTATRLYLPFNLDKKHWIGLCVDFTTSKIYVFDCNSGLQTNTALGKELLSISEKFIFLMKQCGASDVVVDKPLAVEKIKGVAQNTNPANAGITTSLLIQTHALFGP